MDIAKDFKDLLEKNDAQYGDRIALRYDPDDPGATMTYHELYTMVMQRVTELEGRRTVKVIDQGRLSWIITMLGSVIGGHMTVLMDPALTPEYDDDIYDKNYLPGKLLFFTSGTTSKNKAVVLSQEALLHATANGQQMLPCNMNDRLLSILPLFHVFGFVCSFLWPLSQGAEIDLGTGYRGLMTDSLRYHPTIITAVPTLLDLLLRSDALNPELRMILIGAGPCRKELIDQVIDKGVSIRFGYGLTETASGVAISISDHDPYSFCPCPDTRASVTEDEELLISTTSMMDGYYMHPELTGKKLTGGVLHTGDIAVIGENGAITIIGRLDDVLVMPNGEKIYCPEVENDLVRHLEHECVLILRENTLTLSVKAPSSEEPKIRTMIDDYNKTVPLSRKIRKVEIHEDDFPRTITGKIQRYKI
ncbi:MAG: class I adenylate-forming enzyme family protein [Lachnospiraceae bacterium]|nr:class I adenylate-forming enzyme family protein [Lachnospiraceae bacterium]